MLFSGLVYRVRLQGGGGIVKVKAMVVALLLGLVTACPVWGEEALTVEMLRNMAYLSEWFDSGTVPLRNGAYAEKPVEGPSATTVRLAESVAFGQLNDEPVAAVVLVTDPGGSGVFFDLAVVAVREGKPVNLTVAPLGDRVRVESLTIRGNAIHVTMMSHGPDDPSCCPTRRVEKSYVLAGGNRILEEVQPLPAPAVPAAVADGLVGQTWQWVRFEGGDDSTLVVTEPAKYTISFTPDGNFAVTADCNHGNGGYKVTGSSLVIPAFALTMAECLPESLSSRFVGYLGNVASFVLKEGTLYLNLRIDGGNLVFIKDPRK
jgi:heat shock protein HslJ